MNAPNSVPFFSLQVQIDGLKKELASAAERVIGSGQFILGGEVESFEREFAEASGLKRCLGVSSGTAALELALAALDVGPGDEVALPSYSFIATATCVSVRGAKPVFVDVEEDTFLIDARDLARRITPRTKAVIAVHLFGRPADMDALMQVARAENLGVVEDCAQAHLARWKGTPVGAFGDAGAFSFYPTKNIGALGDAGALCAEDPALHEKLSILRHVGRRPGAAYDHVAVGYNARLDALQAAFLRVKLKRLKPWTEARRKIAALYRELLAGTPLKIPPELGPGSYDACHAFVVRHPRREELKTHLARAGIGTAVYYPAPIHLQSAYASPKNPSLPVCQRASREALALPLFPELPLESVNRVCREITAFFSK